MKILSTLLILIVCVTANSYAADETSQQELLKEARLVVEEIMNSPDLGIPSGLLAKAKAVIIFPTMFKGGFVIGARYGKGVATVRNSSTLQWGPPSFITTLGGSVGFQVGAQTVDLILIVMTEKGIRALLNNNFTLGGDIAIAAGPMGRHAEVGVDILLKGDMYSYSRSKGIFGGVSLKGTIIKPNVQYNEEFYKAKLTPEAIMIEGKVKNLPDSSRSFSKYMNGIAPPAKPEYDTSEWMGWTNDPKYGFAPKVMAQNTIPQPAEKEPVPPSQPREEYQLPLW